MALEQLAQALFYQRLDFDEDGLAVLREALGRAETGLGATHSTTRRIRQTMENYAMRFQICETVDFDPGADTDTTADTMLETDTTPKGAIAPGVENLDLPSAYKPERFDEMVEVVNDTVAQLGPQHPVSRRMKILTDGGPIKTDEEYVERIRGCYGPHNKLTQRSEANLRGRDANIARLVLAAGVRTGTLVLPVLWEMLEKNVEELAGILGRHSIVTQGLKALVDGGPVRTLEEVLERLRGSLGPSHSITLDVEKGIKERKEALRCLQKSVAAKATTLRVRTVSRRKKRDSTVTTSVLEPIVEVDECDTWRVEMTVMRREQEHEHRSGHLLAG